MHECVCCGALRKLSLQTLLQLYRPRIMKDQNSSAHERRTLRKAKMKLVIKG